jgi:GNAT superfamily N-acetyltransferase
VSDDLTTRRAEAADIGAVLELLRAAMGRSADERFDPLFRWKHLENAFGPSPAWVALDGERIVAVRYLMRWEFEQDGAVHRAVRAVDTATHPDYQGRGLFKRLTLGAIDELRDEGVAFVFNTPNDQSRPGYLSMGWSVVGNLRVVARPVRLRAPLAMVRARVPAEHFSMPTQVGEPAGAVLADDRRVVELIATARPASARLRTRLDADVLRWRYGGSLLSYRALADDDGLAIFRLRGRGPATEAALALTLSARGRGGARRLVRKVARVVRREADYLVAIGERPLATFVPLPGAGPTVTWRAVAAETGPPALDELDLALGDIELF